MHDSSTNGGNRYPIEAKHLQSKQNTATMLICNIVQQLCVSDKYRIHLFETQERRQRLFGAVCYAVMESLSLTGCLN